MLNVLIASLLKHLFLSIKKTAIATTATELIECPHCKSTETFVSLYKENRYCNNCDRTYNQSDEIRLAHKKEDAKLHMRVSVY